MTANIADPAGPPCRRCSRPVAVELDQYDVFEQMHYVCFHYEFEHDPVDPDEECSAGGCPSGAIHPRPERRPTTALDLEEANSWFAERGFGLAASPVKCGTRHYSGRHPFWVDLTTRDGQILAAGYGAGATLAQAAASARRRWEADAPRPI